MCVCVFVCLLRCVLLCCFLFAIFLSSRGVRRPMCMRSNFCERVEHAIAVLMSKQTNQIKFVVCIFDSFELENALHTLFQCFALF